MSTLKIYKASAGSGKTYTLTEEYLILLLKSPYNYRQILAVTFTNKATAEMRSRILATLSNLADTNIKNPDHLPSLIKATGLTEQEIRKKAKFLLRALLHDYSHFSISTIDSFFQKVTRSFAKEIGLSTEFKLELQVDLIVEEAVDQMIFNMDLPENKELKEWLLKYALEQVEKGSTWDISQEIVKMAKKSLSESFQVTKSLIVEKGNFKDELRRYKEKIDDVIKNAENKIKEISKTVVLAIEATGLDEEVDFAGKTRASIKFFSDIHKIGVQEVVKGKTTTFNNRRIKLKNSIDSILLKKSKHEDILTQLYNNLISPKINEINNLILDYFTALLIQPHLNVLGLINDIDTKIRQISKEKNTFLIADTNNLINKIIDSNEAPFIYEKIGTRYEHFMIDEFQDTSKLQYKNFLPLIQNALSSGNSSLFVGDVKQAIYRWRNSDWNILANEVNKDYSIFNVEEPVLDTNWRSTKDIIEFNNNFFSFASKKLQEYINSEIPETESDEFDEFKTKIIKAYSKLEQKVSPKNIENRGKISIHQITTEKDNKFEELAMNKLIEEIDSILSLGYKHSDITIIVRTNKEGAKISNALLSHPNRYPVISNSSLMLENSMAVKLIISQLEYLTKPYDAVLESFIRLYQISDIYKENQDSENWLYNISQTLGDEEYNQKWEKYKNELFKHQQKPLYNLVEAIITLLPEHIYNQDKIYIKSFLSIVLNFINNENADINQFISFWENGKKDFSLKIPEDQNAIQIFTIHKSKGLEFENVIIPFADFKIDSLTGKDTIWLKPKVAPFNEVGYLPINPKKEIVVYSHFANDYLNEQSYSIVDNLNSVYVAFTRAKKSLTLIVPEPKEKKGNKITFTDLYLEFANNYKNNKEADYQEGDADTKSLIFGRIEKPATKEKLVEEAGKRKTEVINIEEYKHISIEGRIKNHLESKEHFTENESENSALSYGKLMHEIFENIKTTDDIDVAIKELQLQGKISSKEISGFKNIINEKLSNPKVKDWFNGTYTIKTEAEILSSSIKRPDRVMINKEEVIVLDYKFGLNKEKSYNRQVESYLKLVSKIEKKKVRGFLWYINLNEIEEVTLEKELF